MFRPPARAGRRRPLRRAAALALTALAAPPAISSAISSAAWAAPAATDAAACAAFLDGYGMPDVAFASASPVADAAGAYAYCDLRGKISGNIGFAIQLPAAWNGRFLMVGNGGKAGELELKAMEPHRAAGYATATTDAGHDDEIPEQASARFGKDDLEAELDFAYRAPNLVARLAQDVVEAYYGDEPAYSYWNGCSTGGRQGMMEAQRYPTDFDGYLIGAPVYPYTWSQISAPAFAGRLFKSDPAGEAPLISAEQIRGFGAATLAKCDAIDGLVDGLVDDPRACVFDPAVDLPRCEGAAAPDGSCATPAQVEALQKIYAGATDSQGNEVVPGLLPGVEGVKGSWDLFVTKPADSKKPPLAHVIVHDSFNWLMFDDDRPDFNYVTDFDFDVHPQEMVRFKGKIYNADDPDLDDMAKLGGKMLMYHGWADAGINPLFSIRYRAAVIDRLKAKGVPDPEAAAADRLRLYMVPGMTHCRGGDGFEDVAWMDALTAWVERGEAPVALVGARDDGSTRPQCPFPQKAVWDGTGDVKAAASFACR